MKPGDIQINIKQVQDEDLKINLQQENVLNINIDQHNVLDDISTTIHTGYLSGLDRVTHTAYFSGEGTEFFPLDLSEYTISWIDSKLTNNQGVENYGRPMVVGPDGNIIPGIFPDNAVWGKISGKLTDQKDLAEELAKMKNTANETINLLDSHITNVDNPHNVTKSQVGLSRVDNTSDLEKPISTATQAAIDRLNSKHKADNERLQSNINAVATDLGNHIDDKENPHAVTKVQVGLGNVDNTSDANKPISTATQEALDQITTDYQATDADLQDGIDANREWITSHTTNKSNPHSVTKAQVGLGNVDNTSDKAKPISDATQSALDTLSETVADYKEELDNIDTNLQSQINTNKDNIAANKTSIDNHIANKSNPHKVTKAQIGLGNVDNTSDTNKPISTATQTALDLKADKSSVYDKTEVGDLLKTKQDTLEAGDGISIENNVISNTRTNAEWGNITGDLNNQTDLQDALGAKQDKLTAGANIKIEDNVISSTAQESFFRGRWKTWENVPSNADSYPEDFNGNRTPTENDYIAVVDASGYRSPTDETIKISVDTSWHCTINDGTPVNLAAVRDWAKQYVWYLPSGTEIYGINEQINGSWKVALKFNKTVVINGVVYNVGDIFHIYGDTKTATVVSPEVYEGAWRFGYHGTWNTDGVNGWKPEYQIEETLPMATDTQSGIAKLYTATGSNTDGAMTQKATTDAISAHNTSTSAHSNIRGVANGLATLDNNAKVPMSQINDALIGNVSYQGLWNAETNTPFLADPTGGLPSGYKALGYIDFTNSSYIDTGVFIDETDETVEYDIKMTPANTGCFPFGAAGSNASDDNTGTVYFYGSNLEYFAGNTRNIRLGEVIKDKDYLINIKIDQTTQTITVVENDLRASQNYVGSIISPVSIVLGGLQYMSGSNTVRGFYYSGKIYYFIIKKNGQTVKQYQPAQRISDGAYGFYEQVSGEFVVSSGASFASGGGEIEIPKGYYYITTVAGDQFGLHFDVGDWIISAGGYWSKVDNTDAVSAVNGMTGNVVLHASDVDAYNKTEIDDKFAEVNAQINANTEAIADAKDDINDLQTQINTRTRVIIRRWE